MKWSAYRSLGHNLEWVVMLRDGNYSARIILDYRDIKNRDYILFAKNQLRRMTENKIVTR